VASAVAFPGVSVYAFEPLPLAYGTLQRVAAGFEAVRAFPWALGDVETSQMLYQSRNTGSSSLLPMLASHSRLFPGTEVVGQVSVLIRRLDDVLAGHEVALCPPVLLKLDVQGYERHVLAGAVETLKKVDWLIVECSLQDLYAGQSLFESIHDSLAQRGFVHRGDFDTLVSPVTGEVVQVDALFEKVDLPKG
jgi:FkbM family methyltransferase